MKKLLSVLLVVCMCCSLLAGCGSAQGNESENEQISSDFNHDTNRVVTLKNVQFEVPEKWEKSAIDVNESEKLVMCFKSDEVYLKVIYGEHNIENLSDESFKSYLSGLGLRFGGFEVLDVSEKQYEGNAAKEAEVKFDVDSSAYHGRVIETSFASFIFGVRTESVVDYDTDIQKVLESVELVEYDDESEVEEISDLKTDEKQEKEVTDNILFDTDIDICPLKSGSGEVIGTYGRYDISKAEFQTITPEQFADFMDQRVLGTMKDVINYATVVFGDGTGIAFIPGTAVAVYGEIDETCSIVKQIGVIMLEENGMYTYSQTR